MSPSIAFNRIKALCEDEESSEPELISQLKSVLMTNPEVLDETGGDSLTLLHFAAERRSVKFIKVLVETDGGKSLDGGLVRTHDPDFRLPIHMACNNCNVEAAKYLLSIYPESINSADKMSCDFMTFFTFFPLHCVLWNIRATDEDLEDLIRFLLQNDQGAVSEPVLTIGNATAFALHLACERQSLEIVKLVYNKYPQAIHAQEGGCSDDGHTPLDVCTNDGITTFLEAQLQWERQAREQRQRDEQGRLPIHRFLQSRDVPVGTVELMIAANSDSPTARDNEDFMPLHYACKCGNVDVVKFLLANSNDDSLREVTLRGDLPLHIACREGIAV